MPASIGEKGGGWNVDICEQEEGGVKACGTRQEERCDWGVSIREQHTGCVYGMVVFTGEGKNRRGTTVVTDH